MRLVILQHLGQNFWLQFFVEFADQRIWQQIPPVEIVRVFDGNVGFVFEKKLDDRRVTFTTSES
jgi:hypothetical protein